MNTSFEPQSQTPTRRAPRQESRSAKSRPSRTIVHAKLEMTEPGDQDEQEADAVANTIVSGGKIARKIAGSGASSGIAVSQQMESQLSQLQGGGRQMPEGLRNMMESGFGQDFSQVRLHTDSEAASMSSSIHAKAFTLGNDIYFNRGQFSPETSEGQRLVAHELTHVVQGTGKVGRATNNKPQYLESKQALIEHLIITAKAEDRHMERIGTSIDEAFKTDTEATKAKKKSFIMDRNFVLKDGKAINMALNEIRNMMENDKKDKNEIEESINILKRVIIKKQSGIFTDKEALDDEMERMKSLGIDQNRINAINSIWGKYTKQFEMAMQKQYDTLIEGILSEAKRHNTIKKNGPEDLVNVETIKSIDQHQSDLESEKEIIKSQTKNKTIINKNIDVIKRAIRKIQQHRDLESKTLSIKDVLESKRMIMKSEGIDDKEIEQRINKINGAIYDDTDILDIVFNDPDDTKYSSKDGKSNYTKYNIDLHKSPDQWCDLFVHWCFLKAFDPNNLEGWGDVDSDKIRKEILSFTMYEKGTMEGSVNSSIRHFLDDGEAKAFKNTKFTLNEIENRLFKKYYIYFNNTEGQIYLFYETDHKGEPKGKQMEINSIIDHILTYNIREEDKDKMKEIKKYKDSYFYSINNNNSNTREIDIKYEFIQKTHSCLSQFKADIKDLKDLKKGKFKKKNDLERLNNKFNDKGYTDEVKNGMLESYDFIDKVETDVRNWKNYKENYDNLEKNTIGNKQKQEDDKEKVIVKKELLKQYPNLSGSELDKELGNRLEDKFPTKPLKGDVVFFVGHIGLLVNDVKDNDKSITTVEGNTDGSGSYSGNGAYLKTRDLTEVLGFGRPNYYGLKDYLNDYYDKQQQQQTTP